MVLLMAVSFSFAQMKNVKEAKSIANDVKPNFKQAEQLIEEAMKNPETKDLADTWDVAGFIQKRINEEQMKNAFLVTGNLKHYPSEYFIITPVQMIGLLNTSEELS